MSDNNELIAEYNRLVNEYNRLANENYRLEAELNTAINNINIVKNNVVEVGQSLNYRIKELAGHVTAAEVDISTVLGAIKELADQYFIYKTLSEAAKMLTKYTDEYNRRFHYYEELRRISVGYIIGIDAHIISDEISRKKVEQAYLENTDYWLAYCTMAVMHWHNNNREAAERAMKKGLQLSENQAILFFMLVNMRFGRFDAARKWYLLYLERTDLKRTGREWRYLLQAYLKGAFGSNPQFHAMVNEHFSRILEQADAVSVDLGHHFTKETREYAESLLHKTDAHFPALLRNAKEGNDLSLLLSEAEKNKMLIDYYTEIAEKKDIVETDINQRIEDILYSLISAYEREEYQVYKKIKYNEAILRSQGDVTAAKKRYQEMFEDDNKELSFAELLFEWVFSENPKQTDETVRKFSIRHMKKWIKKGVAEFAEFYRRKEPAEIHVEIDGCNLTCDLNSEERNMRELKHFYDTNRKKDTLSDKQVCMGILGGVGSVTALIITLVLYLNSGVFQPMGLIVGILGLLTSGVFIYFRVKDMEKILDEKKRLGIKLLENVLGEYRDWKRKFDAADELNEEAQTVFDQF